MPTVIHLSQLSVLISPEEPKQFNDNELQALFDENAAQTFKEHSGILAVDESTLFTHLHAVGKTQEEGKRLPYKLTENAIPNCFKQKSNRFLWRITTGNKKWIYYVNT